MSQEEQEFEKGFNQGYLIRQHRPDIKLSGQVKGEGEYLKSLVAGGKQYEMEEKREKLRRDFLQTKSQNKDVDRGR